MIFTDPRICPKCGGDFAKVINTRVDMRGYLYRSRRCFKCYETWKSIEIYYDEFENLLEESIEDGGRVEAEGEKEANKGDSVRGGKNSKGRGRKNRVHARISGR